MGTATIAMIVRPRQYSTPVCEPGAGVATHPWAGHRPVNKLPIIQRDMMPGRQVRVFGLYCLLLEVNPHHSPAFPDLPAWERVI